MGCGDGCRGVGANEVERRGGAGQQTVAADVYKLQFRGSSDRGEEY
jgi:hypothetical protein